MGLRFSSYFKKIASRFGNLSLRKQRLLLFGCVALSLTLLFPAGFFIGETKIETTAKQISDLSMNETIGGRYTYLLVEPHDSSTNPLPSPVTEYYYWSSIFGTSKNNFASVVNGNKENNCHFLDIMQDKQLTFLYSPVFSNKLVDEQYRHEFYDIDLMFSGIRGAGNNYSFLYLTQTQADTLLLSRGKMPSQAEYENLLESSISLVMGNITYQWMISNIIVETSEYFSSLKEIFGEFVMAFTKYPEQFNKQFCYLFNEYIYQNSYKIKYLRTNYDSSKYNISFGINNMKSDSNTSLTEIINMIAVDEPSTNVYGYLLTSLSVLLLFLFLFRRCQVA